jgi:hypothetical protein
MKDFCLRRAILDVEADQAIPTTGWSKALPAIEPKIGG